MHSVCSLGCSSYEGAYEEQEDIDIKEEPIGRAHRSSYEGAYEEQDDIDIKEEPIGVAHRSSYEGAHEEQEDIDIKEEPIEVSGSTGPCTDFYVIHNMQYEQYILVYI